MASATELFESGDGDSISDRGDASVSRLFHVVVDAPATGKREDPPDFVLRSTALVGRSAVPVGSPHPSSDAKDRAGLFAARYTQEKRVAPQNYIVRVDYMPAVTFDFSRSVPWLFSFSPGFGTKRISSGADEFGSNIDIGPRQYESVADEAPAGYSATYIDANNKSVTKRLVRAGGRRIEGADATIPIGTMTLTRQLKLYPEHLHTYMLEIRNHKNADEFLARPAGRLKFVGPTVSSSVAPAGSGLVATDGLVWDVTLTFEDTEDVAGVSVPGAAAEFDHVVQDVFEKNGQTVPILDGSGLTQLTYYKLYPRFSFSAMMAVLNAYA